ncbi:hypothetical protein [Halobellus ruber]|uniref:Uncharacterized protein n=1 Tax=Halobellus ruber TaxID=2761102 RepID=A0A7J9SH65_9EURY|nr:hypothetical protein [Halobellus ruber]MBB6646058.1 hypothetical protein [Halobellus ruber]
MSDALLSAGIDRCREAGTTVSRSTDATEPPAIATPPAAAGGPPDGGGASTTPPDRTTDPPTPGELLAAGRPVAVEPLPDSDPTVTLSRLWNNRTNGRATLFVVPTEGVAAAVERLLSPPVGVREADDDGRRFYAGPDRIRLEEGGYAAVPTGPELEWRETRTPPEPTGIRSVEADEGGSPSDALPAPAAKESEDQAPWLELRADGTVLARLAGVDELACPPRARFPYTYHRDRDKQIRVCDFAGRPVQRYPGIAAMRRGGFRPVPAPLVPERLFDGPTAGWWAVLSGGE